MACAWMLRTLQVPSSSSSYCSLHGRQALFAKKSHHVLSCAIKRHSFREKKKCFHNEYSKHSICKWVWSAEGRRLIRSLLPAHVIYWAAAALLLTITDSRRFVHHHHHFHHKPQRVSVYWTLWWHWNCRRALTLSEWRDGSIASRKGMRRLYPQNRNSTRVKRLKTITTENICHWTGKSFTRARMNSLISIPTVRMGFSKVCTTATARACPIRVQLSAVQDGI